MAILAHDCPHCRTAHVSMEIRFGHAFSRAHGVVCLTCPKCKYPSGALLSRIIPIEKNEDFFSSIITASGDPQDRHYDVVHFWPAIAAPVIPEHLPASVARAVLQAERNFGIEGNEEAAAIMYRRAMEAGLRLRYDDTKGSLFQRIDRLVKFREIPEALGEWAHEVRLGGNGAAHDDEPVNRDDLNAIRSFADTLLRYVFTLPEQIRARQASREPRDVEEAE